LKLRLSRHPARLTCYIGDLSVDGEHFAHSLEDLPIPVDGKGKGCIPAGQYTVLLTPSPAVARGLLWSPLKSTELPLLIEVPDRDGIRIHAANDQSNLLGCIGVGTWTGGEQLHNSRAALEKLCDLMRAAKLMRQSVVIEVIAPEEE
jgi:hypothetical protein